MTPRRPMHYYLDEQRIAHPCATFLEWAERRVVFGDRHVAEEVIGDARISTVFLGLDHGWMGPPLLFETMIFGGAHDEYCDRCSTWQEAEAMHARAVNLVRETSTHAG